MPLRAMIRRTLPFLLMLAPALAWGQEAPTLYAGHCAACHGPDRLGGIGPALIPETVGHLKPAQLAATIAHGRMQTEMPAFAGRLTAGEITALAAYVASPLAVEPHWSEADIRASRTVFEPHPAAHPVFKADLMNLFTVVEAGDHHAIILDGDSFTPLARFKTRPSLHGGAKYSPDAHYVYLASRDGWVQKYDLWGLTMAAEVRAGINTRNIAVSDDGKWIAVGNTLPRTLVILDAATMLPVKVIPVADRAGHASRVSAVYEAPPRHSFIVALKDVKELWEIPTRPGAEVCQGAVRTYDAGMESPACRKGPFPVRRIATEDVLDDFFFDPGYHNVMAAARDGRPGEVVNLDVGHTIATLDLSGMPHLGSGIVFRRHGRWLMATPHLKEGKVSVIDMTSWKTVAVINTLGPGFFLRGHEKSRYAWVDNAASPAHDKVQVIDLDSLKIVKTLQPAPGKTVGHVEFTHDGRYALLSDMEMQGALIVYDAKTLREVKRIPMVKPIGKYNVGNKLEYSTGTSH
ncbi:nitrite reductase precursor [mine drainage metagenome]|uniref:Nitrite reductase n=1 Tax=mine drainage metagenome TaxID=410659 RepID=A0A1J5SDB5_9ZZZZ